MFDIDMEMLGITISRICNYQSWAKVTHEVWYRDQTMVMYVKARCLKWLRRLGYEDEAKCLGKIDNRRKPEDDLMFGERERLRKLARLLCEGNAI